MFVRRIKEFLFDVFSVFSPFSYPLYIYIKHCLFFELKLECSIFLKRYSLGSFLNIMWLLLQVLFNYILIFFHTLYFIIIVLLIMGFLMKICSNGLSISSTFFACFFQGALDNLISKFVVYGEDGCPLGNLHSIEDFTEEACTCRSNLAPYVFIISNSGDLTPPVTNNNSTRALTVVRFPPVEFLPSVLPDIKVGGSTFYVPAPDILPVPEIKMVTFNTEGIEYQISESDLTLYNRYAFAREEAFGTKISLYIKNRKFTFNIEDFYEISQSRSKIEALFSKYHIDLDLKNSNYSSGFFGWLKRLSPQIWRLYKEL
jgi:hypothetical protein